VKLLCSLKNFARKIEKFEARENRENVKQFFYNKFAGIFFQGEDLVDSNIRKGGKLL